MDRHVLVSALAAFVLTAGCATAPTREPAPASPPIPVVEETRQVSPCTVISDPDRIALFKVDPAGTITPDCFEITKKNDTIVVWSGLSPIEALKITFKECAGEPKPDKLPDAPLCEEFVCVLGPKAYKDVAKTKKTTVCYSYLVTLPGQAPKSYDPRLIINP